MISLIALYCIVRIMRSEAFARRFGALTGRLVRWSYGIARRKPSDEDFVEATLRFREGIAETWHERGMRVSAAVVGNYVVQGMIFGLSVRAVGLDSSEVPIGAIAVVYTTVRLLTIVNFTPGGVGVTEALYTTALLTVTDGADQSQVVAAVLPLPRPHLRRPDPARRGLAAHLALPLQLEGPPPGAGGGGLGRRRARRPGTPHALARATPSGGSRRAGRRRRSGRSPFRGTGGSP